MDNNFLQSNEWRKFQEAVGRKTFEITSSALRGTCLPAGRPSPYKGEGDFCFSASIVEHNLSVVGKYFYIPHGPVICHPELVSGFKEEMLKQVQHDMEKLINLAKKEKAGWIRVEPTDSRILDLIGKNLRVVKAPHDMQPRETLIIDISKSEEEILANMKSKTRYNIKLAEKKGVSVISEQESGNKKYIEEFLRLTKIMSERQGIVTHDENYYQKMFEIIPSNIIKLYVAEYENKIIAANIVIFYGDTAYYLHGASDDKYKNLMAPHLLQWRQIQDARKTGCVRYDFCGVKVKEKKGRSWEGITRFKLGFSPSTKPVIFPGSYDIVISPVKYWLYRIIQKVKSFVK
ncbi:MAG: peptidoglycan bridge formation glycyltransferase FemA/FemB family protein [Parcubacteria group bacterium]|jgi:lipid II:glycine glycyltransferase (peptidoglycan interpeptide bridge formation enzyme)